MTTKRRSRQSPTPRIDSSGKKYRLRISKRDVAIFKILQRYRFLPMNFIYALLEDGGYFKKYQERLTDLSGLQYIRRPDKQWETLNAHYKKIVYELGRQGKKYMKDSGLSQTVRIGVGNSYHHEVLTCLVIASIEIGCRDFEFIHWPEILNFRMVPDETKTSAKPFNVPLIGMRQQSLVPDGTPFVIKGSSTFCFLGVETDLDTENLTGKSKATIQGKFEGYLNIARNKTYKKHFGFPNMVVPFVTTSETRMRSMMMVLERITIGKGCTFILFKYTPDLRSHGDSPDPVDLLAGAWERVGHPPLDLAKELCN